jgi:hypothetical protein
MCTPRQAQRGEDTRRARQSIGLDYLTEENTFNIFFGEIKILRSTSTSGVVLKIFRITSLVLGLVSRVGLSRILDHSSLQKRGMSPAVYMILPGSAELQVKALSICSGIAISLRVVAVGAASKKS